MGPSFGPLGLGGGVGCLRPVETTKGRLETLLAERSLTDMINGSAGMRVAYLNKNPPTFGSGVLEHVEGKGGGFLPPYPPSTLGALSGTRQKSTRLSQTVQASTRLG